MTIEELKRRADAATALKAFEPFQTVCAEIRAEAVKQFLGASEINEPVHSAHSLMRAIAAIEQRLDRAIAEYNHTAKKEQHRGRHD